MRPFPKISRNVVVLGIVSGLTDISSEMLYPVVPLFLTAVLGAPMSVVGLIEGLAEATASLLKGAVGWISDRFPRRKPFILGGYGLSAASKPLMVLAGAWPAVLLSRLVDRTGKGLRTSPRDSLLAASSEAGAWGASFGFHRAMDTAGAALGPLLAVFLLEGLRWGYRAVFLAAFVPAALGFLFLALFVVEAPGAPARLPAGPPPPLSREFWRFTAAYGIFSLGNSSDVFLLLKARLLGLSRSRVIFAYVLYNAVYALAAAPAGALSDRLGRRSALILGLLVFAAVYLGFALAASEGVLWALFAAYGFYGALTEGVVKAAVADASLPAHRGTAMGVFQGAMGGLALAASLGAGELWERVSPAAPFAAGAIAAVVSAALLLRCTPVQGKAA